MTAPTEQCPHFGECGGCRSQDLPYAEQLLDKELVLRELYRSFWAEPIPVTPSPAVWYYRNRLDFSFGRKRYPEPPPPGFVRESVLGFKRKGQWNWPLDIDECRIASPEVSALLDAVRGWMHAQGLQAADVRRQEGFLRGLLVREAKRTGERMVVLITRAGAMDAAAFVDVVRAAYPASSIQHGVFQGLADVTDAETLELLHGGPTIDEELQVPDGEGLRRLRFRISPLSFFQTNTLATEQLYGQIRAWIRTVAPRTLYDLYGGSGGIALSGADLVEQVVSVESVDAATQDGRHNAEINRVHNATFLTHKVEDYLRGLQETGGIPEDAALVIDPPRAGLHPKALLRLMELAPANLLYISCKPSVFAKELETFLQAYTLRDLRAVDLFPHTPHVEVVAWLSRR